MIDRGGDADGDDIVAVGRVSADYVCSAASTTAARSAGCSFLDTSASKSRSRRCRSTHFGLVDL